ncbi:MAG: LacI family DNA-binding transcriptional regulator [Kineosporiaceae bacterium]
MDRVAQDRPSRPPAITDVARAAGVSHQTVSRVLNQHPSVRPETRSRVLDAIADLGYRRNHAARALVTGRSEQLGVVVLGSLLFGPGSMLSAVEQLADQNGFVVSVASVHRDDPAEVARAVERLLDQSVAGLVLIVPVANAQGALDEIPPGVPYVVIDGDLTREDPLATVDQAHGAYLATRHLLDAGHANVMHVHGPLDWFDSRGRMEGWQRALDEAGVTPMEPMAGDWSLRSGYRIGTALAQRPDVTAVFAANDHMALGILRAMHDAGRRLPEDLSVVGFDDIPEAGYVLPGLTTVRPDFSAAARAGLRLLLEQVESGSRIVERRTVTASLVERESVAPPRS